MAIGDILISDNRHLEFAPISVSGGTETTGAFTDVSKALLSCQSQIMFEIISNDYAFGEQGK